MAESSRKRQRAAAQRVMTAQHQEKLELLETFEFKPSKVLDFDILRAMGWEAEVKGYIEAIGWGFLLNPHSQIYATATKEFLASVGLTESTNSYGDAVRSVDFWMNGGYRTISLDEFNVQAGFYQRADQLQYRDAICEPPEGLTPADMWNAVTGRSDYHSSVKGSRLPTALRICHKLLTSTIHARSKSPESVTRPDLLALYCMVTGQKADPGYFFIEHVKNLGAREGGARQGYILVATLLSRLAETWGCPDAAEAGALAPKAIDAATLVNMKIITRAGGQFVRTDTQDPFADLFFDVDVDDLESGDAPPRAGTSQLDRAYFDARIDTLQQSMEARLDTMQQGIDARHSATQLSIETLSRGFDNLSVWLHQRFPDAPQDPPAEE